jgi:dihydroorotate dehydrogenase (fumarate)
MDLTTTYLGLKLPHPLIPGASPLSDELDDVKELEDAGAAAIVMRSLFEEQLVQEPRAANYYLEHLLRVKRTIAIPVIASINGATPGAWVEAAGRLEGAGADAIELNLFLVPTDPGESALDVEDRLLVLVRSVRSQVKVPLAVKISPFYTSLPHFALRLEAEGADALVVFNRFYEPDIDVGKRKVVRCLTFSRSTELLPRLHALAILSGRVGLSLGVTGGVHTALDALKAVMCGADGVQMVSALLREGPRHLAAVRTQMESVLESQEYDSLSQVKGIMSLMRYPDPKAYERINYMHILQDWRA